MREAIDESKADFAADVQYYLTGQPRQLPSRYLYDELGSALFEAICQLPWYGITRAEGRLLNAYRTDIIRLAAPTLVVELGSGSGKKLKTLLDARPPGAGPSAAHLVDLSGAALARARSTLAESERLRVATYQAAYEEGLRDATRDLHPADRVLVLFLGSNIGNFDPPGRAELLRHIRSALRPGDSLLLGVDLVKPPALLMAAYDDPLGVTAAFNRNLLVRVNRELGGNFAVEAFTHRALWNEEASRVEMHLAAAAPQAVRVMSPGAIDLAFTMDAGEMIWTESSYKFQPAAIDRELKAAGFRPMTAWIDPPDQFLLALVEAS